MKDVSIYVYTEYSGNFQKGSGTYHVVLESIVKTKKGEEPATLTKIKRFDNITRNRLELEAVASAMSHITQKSRITIYTTSEYIINAFIQEWPKKWKQNDFKTKGKPIKHADLWQKIMEQVEKHDVTFLKAETTPYTKVQKAELQQEGKNEKKRV
jgi:ribonuclease HI